MTTTEVQIKGLSALLKDLDTLPDRIERNCVRAALRQGIRVFAREMQSKVPIGGPKYRDWEGKPHRGGELLRSMRIFESKKGPYPSMKLSIGNRDAWYAHIVEGGAKPHVITPYRAKALFFGGHRYSKVNHPGMAGRHFVRDSFYNAEMSALQAFMNYLNTRLPRELNKQQSG